MNTENTNTDQKNSQNILPQWDIVHLDSNQTLQEEKKSDNITDINNNPKNILDNINIPLQSDKPKINLQVKQWNRVSSSGLLLWCVAFFVVFVWILFWALFFSTSNPQTLQSIGLDSATVKTLLNVFAGLFFGVIILSLLWLTSYNGYKAATIKDWSKAKNIFGLVVSLLFMLIFVGLALFSFSKIKDIQISGGLWSSNLILPYMEIKKNPNDLSYTSDKRLIFTTNTKIIWPVNIFYQINNQLFTDQILSTIWQNSTINYIKLDCGNGQILDSRTSPFNQSFFWWDPCFYTNKWTYEVVLEYNYTALNGISNSIKQPVGSIDVISDISFLWTSQKYIFNDKKSEIIVGNSPTKVSINAQKIFTDLWLTDVNIARDLDGNGTIDKKDRADFTQYYLTPKLYSIYYTLPNFDYTFVAKVRVNAGDVPLCKVTTESLWDSNYKFGIVIDDNQIDILNYKFDIIDQSNGDIIKSINSDKKIMEYGFDAGKIYKVRWFFTTTENKNWLCESDDINIGNKSRKILTTFFTKLPTENDYNKIDISWQNTISDSIIEINDLPILLQFRIEKTVATVASPKYEVYMNSKIINPSSQWVYTISIEDSKPQKLQIKWYDDVQKEYYKNFNIIVKKKNVIAKIAVDKAVWFDPLTVKLDASITKLNDYDDEIIYFTWDFGDGTKLNNISQWKITHSYVFDMIKESGEYYPKVTIKTKKWYTDTYTMPNPIIVKRQIRTAKININSHPWQVAKIWDIVSLSLQTDWDIKNINRSFGNDKNISCDGRSCMDTNVTYAEAGYYDIVAQVDYNDAPSSTQVVKLKVE